MDFSWDDVEPVAAPTGETGFSWNDVEEPQAKAEPTWEGGDGKPAALPEGETNEWGGNLRNEGRKVLIRRGENGKVNGYSTTSSMIVKDEDGKIAVIPTVVDGKELSPDEAVKHYAKTGEHWGKADDEDSAREIARKVHERHEEDNRKGWNDYIHSHWDEMDDSIRNDRGTAYEHRKREDPDSITDMERLAHDDTSKERFHRQYKAGRKEGEDAAADMDDLAEIAKGAGLEDWQVERIRRESKDAEEMRKNLAYVAGNRVGNETGQGKKGGKLTDYIRSAAGAVSHAVLDRIPDITKAAGTALGGKSDETQSFMTDDQYARKEGEDVRQWARRKGIHLNRKNFDAWNEFFKWEAPIEGKEGMRPSKSLMAPGRGENRSTMERIGDELVKIGNQEQADIDRIIPRHLTGNPVMNFIEDTASGVGGFMFAGPLMVGTAYGSSYQSTRDYALQNGATPEQADALGKGAGVIDTALTAAFYRAPVRKWMKSKGIAPVMDPVKNHSFSEMSRAVGNFAMKKVALEQSAAALEAGAILGIQGAADEAIRLKAEGKDLDTLGSVGDIAISGIEGAVSGAGVGLVMGGAHLLGARANARRAYRDTLREVIRPEAGNAAKEEAAVLFRQRLAELNPEATADFCEAFERGSVATKKQVDAAGLPPMSVVERGQYWELLKAQGITSESIRKNAKLGMTAEGAAAPEAPVAPEVPPSDTLSGKIEEMGGEPVRFSIPQDENGKPRFTTMAWRDNRTGKEGKNRIAIDERTQVAIMDNGDGTFTAYDNLQNAVDSDNLDDAIENANELALAQQYTNIERQKKLQVIENAHASKFGEKNVVAFPTMADAVNQIGNSIRQGNPIFGITSISGFTNPRNGFREDRKGFTTPDGTTVLIVDNIDDPADVERLLRHETIGHGGPNSEFGNGVDDFLSSLGSDEFSRRRGDLIKSGMSPEEADSKRGKREIFANMLQEREHNPTVRQRLGSWLNGRARQKKLKKTYSDADIEVMASRWEKEARGTNGDLDLREPGDRFEFIELEDEAPRETHENTPVSAPKETQATSRPEAAKPVEKREPAKSEPSKPVSERNIVEKLTDKAEAQEIPLSEIEVSDSRIPQFKEGADPETGEVEPLTGEPYDLVSNPIVVMEFKDGKKVVVTGRHRYGLYKRSGRKTIAARVIREVDGWTVKDAMAIDAIGNIIDEKGTEKDYVKYFDEAKPTRDEAKSAGFLDRPKGQRAFSIYEGATADTKQLIDWEGAGGDGKISVDQAGIISAAAPKGANPRFGAVQRILTQKALGGLRGKKLGILARSLAEEAKNRKETPKVGGEMQLDLFTSEEDQALLAMEDKRADYRVKKSGEYNRIAEVLRTAVSKGGKLDLNGEYAKELGITDPKDKKQLIAARDKAIERANYWENAVVLDEADKTSMDESINAKSGAEAAKREEIQKKAEAKLAAVKEKRTGKKSDVVVAKTETTTPTVESVKSAIPVDARDGLIKVSNDVNGAITAWYAPGSEEEVSRARKALKEKFADADVVNAGTSVSVIQAKRAETTTPATAEKKSAVEKPKFDGEYGKLVDEYKAAEKRIDDSVENEKNGNTDEVARLEALNDRRVAELQLRKFEKEHGMSETFDRTPDMSLSSNEISKRIRETRNEIAVVKAERAKEKSKVASSEEPVKTPVKSQEEELTEQEKARSAANAAFSAMTGIPVVQVGKNGKILSDSTPAAEKAISGKGAGKSAVKSAEPKTKMKDAASEAKAQKLEDDLGALFMSEEYDPSAPKKEVSKWRKFDVKKPDGEKGSVHAYTMRQAQGAAEQKYGRGATAYEQGGLENAIIREREGRARDRISQVHAQYPVGARLLGPAFDRAVTASVDGGSAQQVASLLVSAQRGRDLRHSVFAIGRRDKLTDSSGASHYTDGTVVVPLHDGKSSDPFKFNRELLKVLANAEAFGELNDIEFLRGNEGRIYGMVSGKPVVRRVNPSEGEVAKFLESKGFKSYGVHHRTPGMVWGKGNVNVNQNDLRFGSAPDGSLVPLFSDKIGTHSEAGLNFASGEFDPAIFQKRVGVLAELAKTYADNGVGTFETLADRMYAKFADKFDAMKPYLRGIWNAVAEQLDLPEVTREQANDVFARIEKPSENEPTVERPTEKALTKGERISNAADKLVALIEKGEKFDRRTLEETVAKHFGGSVAEGTFTPKDASDILELAVNRVVLKRKGELSASSNASVDEAVGAIGEIRKILGVLPTQTVRSDEQIKMQQFSTPPHEAFAVNWVANIRPGDVALEPSAGIGGIAVFAKASGARKIVANELSDRRREILNELGIADNLYGVDAAKIWQHLFWEVNKGNAERPTVVVMNPPFSSSVVSGRHSTIGVGGAHIEAALDSLAQGGRLVAVVGNGMSYDSPSKSAAAWWKKIGSKYRVMANVRVNGNEYAKYGTDFDNNIIVIDKVEPDPTVKPVFGKIESLDEFPALVEGVRNARPGSNQQTESASDKQTGRGGNETPTAGLVSVGKPEQPDGRTGSSGSSSGTRGRTGKQASGGNGKGVAGNGQVPVSDGNGGKGASGQSGRVGNAGGRDGLADGGDSGNRIGEAGGRAGDGAGLLVVSDLKSENPQGENEEVRTVGDGTFAEYKPSKLNIPGMKPHPGEIVESAAMASVKTPDITYSPRIPKELVEKGQPSAAQLEVITLAGQAGEQKLPNGQRRGFFTQDGTGMGKGTEIGGVICDNFNHGRKKAIWISKNADLFTDAQRDLSAYGLQDEVFKFGGKNAKDRHIAFLSYDTLSNNASVSDKDEVVSDKGGECNFQKLVKWFGKDYDGVIVFDESHMMANVEGKTSKRGKSEGAKRAIIAVKLQEALPNARVLYASATGATEVSHLACLPRLGLWGEGTSFKTKGEFIDKISKGGLSMMEMVARDMKASGLTLSRSLTMEGIVNRPLVHNLSPDQTRRYDECAAAWQEIYDNIFDTVASTGEIHNGRKIGQIIGQMKTSQQRFFNSLLTSMMLPSVIPDMKRNLASGKSIVIQLTETNEAALKRAIGKGQNNDDFDPENIDTSPREIIRGYVERYFPTFVYTEVEDTEGKKSWRIAEDADGKPLQDPAAVERKNAILDKIDMMRMDGSPLDAILSEFGYANVAEVTGRSKRIERVDKDGEIRSDIVSRSKKKGEAEANEFNDGKRRILIFSEAGGTGKSYHASRTYENQQQRIHYLLQAGWSAPPAIQGLGRTNRTNQASKPEYVLCTTDVKGHLRFISSVARRLQQMGSLTSGDRSTAGNGVFNDEQNIEDVYSKRAINQIFTDLYYNNPSEFTRVCRMFGYIRPKVDTETGERTDKNMLIDEETGGLDSDKIPDVTDFLNIMLHLRIADMNRFFDQFMQTRNNLIENAKENGKYDPGLEKLVAEKVVEKKRTQIYEDPSTGSKTEVVELGVSHKSRKRSLGVVKNMMDAAKTKGRKAFFAVNKSSNMFYALIEKDFTTTDSNGKIHKMFYRLSPDGTASSVLEDEIRLDAKGNYTEVADGETRWEEEYNKVPDLIEGNNYYVTGAILPVFGRLGIEDPRVKRIEPTGKKTSFLGLEIPNSMVDQVMANFGEGDASAANSPGAVYRRIVNDGKGVDLQRDGWKLRRARVNYDTAIELVGLEGPEEARRLEQLGYGRFDRSSGKPRFFIPRTEAGVAKFLADYPVKVDEAPQVNFDSDEFSPEDEEKTFGITNEDEKFMLEAASMPIPKHVTKADDILMVQAEHLLSNRDFMRKLAHAVTQKARPTSDAQNVALGIYSEQCADALNAAKAAYDDQVRELELLPPDAEQETVDVVKKSIAALRKELAGARRDFREAATAKRMGASEQGRALRTNRFLFSTADYSYAGLRGIVQSEIGKAEMPEKMDEEIGRLAENFKDLDDRSRGIAVERLKLFSQKVVNDLKAGGRKASSGPKAAGNELKRVMRNYEDALNQVQVHADEAGGTLIGMADQLYPSWGKWLKAIGEYHCFMRPEITEQEVIDAIRADLGRYLTDGIDEETVRDVLTGFGHNYRQSRYDSQRKMNDLKAQALSKRQRDYMIENGKLPPQTGMVRDEASDETRALRKEIQELKKDLDEQEGGPRALKGALASAKTRVRNTIADLENAIARGEKIERSHRTLMEDAELRELKKRRDELREEYDALFGEKSTMTDEQRLQRTEKMLRKSLERAIERLAKAQAGDFSTAPRVRLDNATTMQLREEIDNTNRIIRNLKDAAYPMGTPEEIAKRNANRMKRREEAIQRLQARIISGDVRPLAKPVPEMPKEMQARYDELGAQMKAAHRKLQQLREEARHATWFAVPRAALDGFNYLVGSIMTNAASYDRSAVLRQALRLTAANPVEASKAYVKAEKAAWNEDYFNEVNDKLLSDPIIDEGMEKHGLRLHSTDIAHIHTVELFKTPNSVEPRIITRIGQMIGGIPVLGKIGKGLYGAHTYIKAGSERHYVTYLNLMAGQTYKLLVDAVPGGASDFQKRKFAGLVNILTGAASIPENLRHGINMVNTIGGNVAPVIWSPSLWMSQIQQVGLADVWGAYTGKKDDVKPGANAYAEATYVAKEAMKLRIRAGLAIAALGALLSYAFGNDDWWNELVADARRGNLWRIWNKIHHPVIGKTHIDLEMGERTFSKTLGAFVTTKTETSTGRTKELGSYGTGDWYSMLGRYAGGKLSPMYSAIIALRFGRDYVGNPYGVKEFASSWVPLSVGDVFQSAMEDSWLDGTAPVAVAMTMLGAGGSVYDEKYYERTVNPFLETVKEIENTRKDRLLDESDKKEVIDNILMSAGGIFSDNLKWRKAYGLAQQISAADNKLKSEFKKFETALESGRKLDEASIMRRFEDAEGKLNVRKRELMDMIQQGKDNYLRPWRR